MELEDRLTVVTVRQGRRIRPVRLVNSRAATLQAVGYTTPSLSRSVPDAGTESIKCHTKRLLPAATTLLGNKPRDQGASGHADMSHDRARDLRREGLLMRAFQSRITGPVLRRIAGPQNILEMGMAFWSSRVVLAVVEFGVFNQLATGPLSGEELMDKNAGARCSWTVPSRATSAP
jgi:hypothetical protein